MGTNKALAITFALAMSTSQAFAQAAAPDKTPPGTNAPSQFDSQSRQSQREGDSLSERLARSGGVIKPPEHADKDIYLTPPPTGDRMAVPPNTQEKNATPK